MLKNKKNILILLVVLLCISIFSLTGYFWSKSSKHKASFKELYSMSENIRNSFKNTPGYWGLNTQLVINKKLSENISEEKIISSLNKEVVVGYGFSGTTLMPGSKTFDIVYKGLNRNECVALSSFELDEEQKVSLISIIIKSGDKEEEFSWGGDNKLPISINIAKRFCKEENDILWRFE